MINTGSTDPPIQILELLFENDACLYGRCNGTEQFKLLNITARENGEPEWNIPVPRIVAEVLLQSGWIEDDIGASDSVDHAFHISELGRQEILRRR